MLRRTSFVVGFVMSMIEGVAKAEPEPSRPQLGDRGSVALHGAGAIAMRTRYASSDASVPDVTMTTISFQPGADVFVLSRFSVGGSFLYGHVHSSLNDFTLTSLGAGARVGYVIPLTTGLHLWPRVGVDTWRTRYAPSAERYTSVGLMAYMPLVVEPAPHFFVGFGPRFERTVSTQNESRRTDATAIGVATTIGGYFLPASPRWIGEQWSAGVLAKVDGYALSRKQMPERVLAPGILGTLTWH